MEGAGCEMTDVGTRGQVLDEVAAMVRQCTRCELCRGRTHAVPGHGAVDAEIMFIGEAPGWNEDKQGLPFVGAAGQFLNELLASINLDRNSVFITNVVKCRPPGNRDPRHYERAEEFLIERNPVDHLSFGYGVHACAGQGLAKLEAHAVLNSLVRRVKSFRIGEAKRKINNSSRPLESVPVFDVVPA